METSWWEQRHWGITLGIEALQMSSAMNPSGPAAQVHAAVNRDCSSFVRRYLVILAGCYGVSRRSTHADV